MHRTRNIAARAGRWSARHKKTAITAWLAFVAVAIALGSASGMNELTEEDYGGSSDSARGERILRDAFPRAAEESVLVQSPTGDRAALRAGVADVRAALRRLDRVELEPGVETSRDGRSMLVRFKIPEEEPDDAKEAIGPILAAVERAADAHPELVIGQFGDASAQHALDERFEDDFRQAEVLSLPITLAVLIVAFGALVAAAVPVVLALSAVGAAIGLTAFASQVMPVDQAVSSVILLIGMAVGVDYSLFYLRRQREERDRGASALRAIDIAAATSGRAVLVSGLTVMVAMAGMFITGNATFSSFAVGTILVVAAAMIGSITVLPALIAALGTKVDKGRVPFLHRLRRRDGESRLWGVVLDRVLRRPALAAALGGGALVALAVPAFGLHTANSGVDDLPRDLEIMRTYDRMQAAFPGGQIPAVVVVRADDVTAPAVRRGLEELERAALASGRMEPPVSVSVSPDRTVAAVSIPLRGDGTDDVSNAALATLRERVIPQTIATAPGVDAALVTGMTAGSKDFNDEMKAAAPLVFAFVLSLAFLLLLVEFRSIVIPVTAIVLNLLSVAAAYGVLVLVFQHGWGAGLLGVDASAQGAITSWLPIMLFVVLFGLSMDYHVLILSRIREAYDAGMPTADAVSHGIRTTAGVVTSAAVVMVAVFAIFGTLSFVDMKQMGVGLSAAVLIDATIVRAVLLPATMTLLGDGNWYLPGVLARRLPRPARATA
jgi:RND superfamily putative drug exporter